MSDGADVGVNVQRGAAGQVLRNRSFRNLLLASVTSSMGDWIGLFALIALAQTLAGTNRVGALAVSFVMIARIVPTIFIAPIAGVYVDRWDRKRTMIVTDIVRGAIMFTVPFVGDAFQLVIATFVIEVAAALFIPAKDATVPSIVPKHQLVSANQLSLFSSYSTLPVGALLCALVISGTVNVVEGATGFAARFPGVAAFLLERPEAVPIMLNAASFFLSIVFLVRMRVPTDHLEAREAAPERKGALRELRDGLAFIAGMPLIRALVVGIMAAFMAAGAVIGVGEFFARITNAGEAGFAYLGFIVGTGLVLGIVSAGPLSRRIAKERLFAPGIMLAGLALIVAAFMPTLPLAIVPGFLMGWGSGISFILGYTMLQEYSEDEVRGRIFAAFNTAIRAALFASLVLGPLTIFVLGVERTEAQIAQGEIVTDLEALEGVSPEAVYPYQIGGVRLTLIFAGMIAFVGAVGTGSSISRVLAERRSRRPGLQDLARDAADRGELPGTFIVFEGGEGAGKTTQSRLLRAVVERLGHEVVVTREPGGTPTGEHVRALLLAADGDIAPRAEALLYAASRAQHTTQVLLPALARGAVVLCDRFVDSSIVYQGVARGLGTEVVTELNRWATDELAPDLTILLDVPADAGLRRATHVDGPDRLEAEGLSFHGTVNDAFRHQAARHPGRYLVLDATEPVEVLHAQIRARVEALLSTDADGSTTDVEPPSVSAVDGPDTAGADDVAVDDAHAVDGDALEVGDWGWAGGDPATLDAVPVVDASEDLFASPEPTPDPASEPAVASDPEPEVEPAPAAAAAPAAEPEPEVEPEPAAAPAVAPAVAPAPAPEPEPGPEPEPEPEPESEPEPEPAAATGVVQDPDRDVAGLPLVASEEPLFDTLDVTTPLAQDEVRSARDAIVPGADVTSDDTWELADSDLRLLAPDESGREIAFALDEPLFETDTPLGWLSVDEPEEDGPRGR